MAVIVIPERWQRQPTGPVEIDWHHGMAGDLMGAFVGGMDVNRATPNTPPIYTNTASAQQAHVATEYGVAREAGGVSGQVYWECRRAAADLTSGITAWGRVMPLSGAPSNLAFSLARDNSSQRFGWHYQVTTRYLGAYIRDGGGTQYTAPSDIAIAQRQWHDGGAVYSAGLGLSAYMDGAEIAFLSLSVATPLITRFALANTSGVSFLVPVCYLWAGAHPEFMPELSRNPWQLLKKRQYKFISISSGPVAPELKLPGVIDIGTTSARPRVTLDFA